MQKRIAIDGWSDIQPSTFEWSFETTVTEDSGRAISGAPYITPLFTVQAYDVEYEHLPLQAAKTLLQKIVQRPSKPYFSLYAYSPFSGTWETKDYYVGDGSLTVGSLEDNNEYISRISCRFVGRNKLC